MAKTMAVILKSGVKFEHQPPFETDKEWEDFMIEAATNVGRRDRNAALIVHGPTIVYDLQEIAAIHFGDTPKPLQAMGFKTRE